MWSKKAYLLEFYNHLDTTKELAEAFAFSLPPQSEDFTFPQRVLETKTFGGSVFDDYGNDTVKIVISGTTANNEIKHIYRGKKGSTYLSGEDEVFTLQKIIQDFGNADKLGKKSCKLTCLSSQDKGHKQWQVVIENFQIRRSSDKPMAYNYTLTCIGFVPEKKKEDATGLLTATETKVKEFCDKLDDLLSKWDILTEAQDYIASVRECINRVKTALSSHVSLAKGYIQLGINAYEEIISLGPNILSKASRIIGSSGLEVLREVKELSKATKEVVSFFREINDKEIRQDVIEQYQKNAEEIKEIWKTMATDAEIQAAAIECSIRNANSKADVYVLPNKDGDKPVIVYGYTEHIAKDSDSYDSLAYKYYNDASLGVLIASYNTEQIKAGSRIYIPILTAQDGIDAKNEVIPVDNQKDNMGSDVKINESGDLSIEQGDFASTKGLENLEQAISLRLNSAIESRIRLEAYGIKSNVGDIGMMQGFLYTSIQETLLNEPRISAIKNISFKGEKESLYVEVVYEDINGNTLIYGGSF